METVVNRKRVATGKHQGRTSHNPLQGGDFLQIAMLPGAGWRRIDTSMQAPGVSNAAIGEWQAAALAAGYDTLNTDGP